MKRHSTFYYHYHLPYSRFNILHYTLYTTHVMSFSHHPRPPVLGLCDPTVFLCWTTTTNHQQKDRRIFRMQMLQQQLQFHKLTTFGGRCCTIHPTLCDCLVNRH